MIIRYMRERAMNCLALVLAVTLFVAVAFVAHDYFAGMLCSFFVGAYSMWIVADYNLIFKP